MPFRDALRAWAKAHRIASDNPSLMIEGSTKNVEICTRRMVELGVAWAVLEYFHDTEINEEMRVFRKADADRGCSSCWLSSSRSNNHPECERKIARWFAAREALVKSGESCV